MFQRSRCPCGAQRSYDACCGRMHRGGALAETAQELMRARFAAYAVDDLDYVFSTWHPRTRPAHLQPTPDVEWKQLEIVEVLDGGESDESGIVEFRAHFDTPSGSEVLHERSTFERRAGRWVYVAAV